MFESENLELSPVEVWQIIVLQDSNNPIEGPLKELAVNLLLLIRHQLVRWHLLVVRRQPLHAFKSCAYTLQVFLCDQARYLFF